MNAPTTSATTTTRAAQVQAFLLRSEVKGYANEKTLRRAMADTLAGIDRDGLSGNFEIITIASGKHAGRVVPVLVFGPREEAPHEAFFYVGRLPLFQYRA